MISITELASQLREMVEWQETPVALVQTDYEKMIINALKRLYVDTGRASEFTYNDILTENEEVFYNRDLQIDEEAYLMLLARIEFFKKIQTDSNVQVSYVTDALSVANADKPYANLKNTIEDLENERRIIFYKMVRFCVGD